MTAPTINGTRYPQPVDNLLPKAAELADRLGETPSRNRLMREFRIGAPKAEALRVELARVSEDADRTPVDRPAEPAAVTFDYAEPIGPDPAPAPTVPGSDTPDAPATRRPGWRRTRKPKTQVTPVGHPGTPPAAEPSVQPLRQLKRIRLGVRAVLALGVAASIAGNVLHAHGGMISQIISAWSPLALLFTIELISRVPVHRRGLALARWSSTALIAGIAAYVSYFHMVAVAAKYGEQGVSAYLLPLSVDGLVVVASVSLVELAGRITAGQSAATR